MLRRKSKVTIKVSVSMTLWDNNCFLNFLRLISGSLIKVPLSSKSVTAVCETHKLYDYVLLGRFDELSFEYNEVKGIVRSVSLNLKPTVLSIFTRKPVKLGIVNERRTLRIYPSQDPWKEMSKKDVMQYAKHLKPE